MPSLVSLANAEIAVDLSPVGAELMSLRDAQSREWLWQGSPLSWPRRAPMLFPVIGRCAGGGVRHKGRFYKLTIHGYAPDKAFSVLPGGGEECTFRCDPDAETRAVYPFDLRLDVTFQLDGPLLRQTATVTNLGDEEAAAALGFHPGFQWPLPSVPDRKQTDHVVLFDREETAPIRRIRGGLLSRETFPNEIDGRVLHVRPELFATDAMFFDRPASRGVWFGVPGQPGVKVDYPDCPQLGLWMRPGAPYLCIEPWQGHDHPEGFDGDVLDSPGMVRMQPGERFARHLVIEIGAAMPR